MKATPKGDERPEILDEAEQKQTIHELHQYHVKYIRSVRLIIAVLAIMIAWLFFNCAVVTWFAPWRLASHTSLIKYGHLGYEGGLLCILEMSSAIGLLVVAKEGLRGGFEARYGGPLMRAAFCLCLPLSAYLALSLSPTYWLSVPSQLWVPGACLGVCLMWTYVERLNYMDETALRELKGMTYGSPTV